MLRFPSHLLVLLQPASESTSPSAYWVTPGASTSWRRLAVMPSTPTRVWFGVITRQAWVDNHKAAVTAHVPGAVRFNERFKQLARHYGFVSKACRPYRPRTKGKVERLVGYVK